jgi:hypothetical protein
MLACPLQAPLETLTEEYITICDKKSPAIAATEHQEQSTVDESSIARFPLLKPVPKHARLPSSLDCSRVDDSITTSSFSTAAARVLADAHAHEEAPRLEYFARKEDVAPIGGLQESEAGLNATALRSAERRSMPVSIVIHDPSNVMLSKPMHSRPTISPVFFPAHNMMSRQSLARLVSNTCTLLRAGQVRFLNLFGRFM